MIFNETAEILDNSYHLVSGIFLKAYLPDKKVIVTSIPRSSNSIPISFESNKFFHINLTNFEKIYFFKVVFMKIEDYEDKPCYFFKVIEDRSMVNNRKEPRESVYYQGVSTDDTCYHVIQVLDISPSGIKVETSEKINSEFVDVFFEENGEKRAERGRVIWARESPNENFYLFGIEFQNKRPS